MIGKRYTPEQYAYIVSAKIKGDSSESIAKHLGTTAAFIRTWVARNRKKYPEIPYRTAKVGEIQKTLRVGGTSYAVKIKQADGTWKYSHHESLHGERLKKDTVFTPDMVSYLQAHLRVDMTVAAVATHFGLSAKQVSNKAQQLGIRIDKVTRPIGFGWSADDEAYLIAHFNVDMRPEEIAKRLGRSVKRIYGKVNEMRAVGQWFPEMPDSMRKDRPVDKAVNRVRPSRSKQPKTTVTSAVSRKRVKPVKVEADRVLTAKDESGGQWVRLNSRTLVYRKNQI